MRTVNMHEAKTHLSKLVALAVEGESFIIAKGGKPLVKVVPVDEPKPAAKRRLGGWEGMFKIPDDFNTVGQAEIEAMFYGED